MSKFPEMKPAKLRELEERYAREDFEVVRQPGPEHVPFALSDYRPDLLVRRGDQHYLIDVRTPGLPLPMDRMAEVAREVRKLPGWRYYVFTVDDTSSDAPGIPGPLPGWPQLRRRADEAIQLAHSGTSPLGAALELWSVVEGILRKKGEDAGIFVAQHSLESLLESLLPMGELNLQQFDALKAALGLRRRMIHGYATDPAEVAATSRQLIGIAQELLRPRVEQAA